MESSTNIFVGSLSRALHCHPFLLTVYISCSSGLVFRHNSDTMLRIGKVLQLFTFINIFNRVLLSSELALRIFNFLFRWWTFDMHFCHFLFRLGCLTDELSQIESGFSVLVFLQVFFFSGLSEVFALVDLLMG